ncbi:MAG: FG-GAP repeat protein [Myxococcota bacterium]
MLVGAPARRPAIVAALSPDRLSELGAWLDFNPDDSSETSSFGEHIAVDPEGARVAIGARSGRSTSTQDGVVYVLDGLPDGDEEPVPRLTLHGDLHPRAGLSPVAYLDLTGAGAELIVATGSADPDYPNAVFRFDPDLVGSHGVDDARARITGRPILGQQLAGWDADGDGLAELVTSADDGVIHFPGPWLSDLVEADADVLWSERDPADQLADTIEVLGDLDGDGRPDLAITANTFSDGAERGGAAYLVPAGPIRSMPAEDLAFQVLGVEAGEGVGSAATSGDFDGDGHPDLVVGAYGLLPGRQTGKVLGFLGPLAPGVRTAADADFVVHGEHVFDTFGAEAVAVDADHDARDDLVVSAQTWDGRGKVYLFHGTDLLP